MLDWDEIRVEPSACLAALHANSFSRVDLGRRRLQICVSHGGSSIILSERKFAIDSGSKEIHTSLVAAKSAGDPCEGPRWKARQGEIFKAFSASHVAKINDIAFYRKAEFAKK